MIRWLENLIVRTDKWYTKSNLPRTLKEFIFAAIVITTTLTIEICEYVIEYKRTK